MSSAQVSVIIPVYNAAKYLSDCLTSVANQTFENIEVVIVDDGSTDDSFEICRRFEFIDNRFRLYKQENAGPGVARNQALSMCNGEWVMFLDADDLLTSNCVKSLLDAAKFTKSEIVVGGYAKFTDTIETVDYVVPHVAKVAMESRQVLRKILYQEGLDIAPWGKLFKRDLFRDVVFPPMRSSEDVATIYKPFLRAAAVAVITDSGYRYRQVKGSLSYSKHESNAINAMKNAAHEIVAVYPELQLPCCSRRLSFAFHVFLIADDPGAQKDTWNEILATRRSVLFDKSARRKARVAALVSYLGPSFCKSLGLYLGFAR